MNEKDYVCEPLLRNILFFENSTRGTRWMLAYSSSVEYDK